MHCPVLSPVPTILLRVRVVCMYCIVVFNQPVFYCLVLYCIILYCNIRSLVVRCYNVLHCPVWYGTCVAQLSSCMYVCMYVCMHSCMHA